MLVAYLYSCTIDFSKPNAPKLMGPAHIPQNWLQQDGLISFCSQ